MTKEHQNLENILSLVLLFLSLLLSGIVAVSLICDISLSEMIGKIEFSLSGFAGTSWEESDSSWADGWFSTNDCGDLILIEVIAGSIFLLNV